MRIVPFLTSIIVALCLYVFIMERDWLVAQANGTPEPAAETIELASSNPGTPVRVVTQHSAAQAVASGIVLRGRTEAVRKVDVKSEVTGLIISNPLPRGSVVREGQTLCELDAGTKNAQLIEAKARLTEAEANNRASERLAKQGYTAETTAIARLAQLEAARAAVEQAEKELSRLVIKAPFEGLLETDTAQLGALLQPGMICASIIDLDPIKFVGFVPERDITRITVGGMAGARLVSGEEARGFLTFLSRSADPLTRTFRVEVTVPNAALRIRDGMTAEIFVALDGEKAHLLPQSVLTLDDTGRLGVRIAEGDVARFVPVDLIRDSAEGVWLAGLPEEADVIIVGQEYVVDGRSIDVTKRAVAQ